MTPRREQTSAPYLALLAVQVFFGSLPVIAKPILRVMPALEMVGFRVGITAVMLALFQAFRGRFWLQDKRDYWRLAVLSLFGVTFNQILFISGLSLTKAANTSLLAATIPIFAIGIGAAIGTERLRIPTVVGIILAALGVLAIIDPRNASFTSQTTAGDILIVCNSLAYGIYVATSKAVFARNGAMRSIMWVFLFAAIICVPLGVSSTPSSGETGMGASSWAWVAYIAIFATAAPYLLNAWALASVNPSTVAVFIYLQPIIGFILAVFVIGETIDLRFVVAAAMILAGVYLTVSRSWMAA